MKKKKEAVGAPLWMVTYSDMVTLLLTFFVMLLAMANFEDIKRIDAVLGSIQASLGMGNQTVSGNATGDEEEEGKVPAKKRATRKKVQKQMVSTSCPAETVLQHYPYQWYFVTKIVLTDCDKKLFY